MKKILYILLSVVLMVFTVSCEINLPTISDSGTIPYQRPDTPTNVKVMSGNKDKIVITWDPVENASYYVIEGAVSSDFGERFSVFGNTTATRFEINRSSEVRSDKSYLFTIRAVTKFGNGETFASLNSDYVEGALAPAPEDIQFYSVVTDDTVSAYWNIPTFFSTLHGDEVLYDAEFTLSYKLKEGGEWAEIKGVDVNPTPGKPWMFHQIDINSSNLKQNEDYLFRIGVEVTDDESGDKSMIYSDPLTLILHSDKIPSAIPEFTASTDSITGIDLKWTVPDWTFTITAGNCFFKVERAPEGTEDWITVFDELKLVGDEYRQVSSRDDTTTPGVVYGSYTDVNSAENDIKGKNFVYRITNAACAEKVLYVQDTALTVSKVGHMYTPGAVTLSGDWSVVDDARSNITLNYTLGNAVPEGAGLTPVFISEYYTPESKVWTAVETVLTPDTAHSQEFGSVGTYKAFRYFFELRDSSGNSYIDRLPVVNMTGSDRFMKVPGLEGTYPVLGNTFPAGDSLAENIAASNNRYNKIVVTFDELRYEGKYTEEYQYVYSEDNGSSFKPAVVTDVVGPVTEGGMTRTGKQFVVENPVNATEDIILKVTSGKFVDSVVATDGTVLAVPADIALDVASVDGNSFKATWNPNAASVDNVSYAIAYKTKGAPNWTDGTAIDFTMGECVLDLSSKSAGTYEFAFAVSNSEHSGEGTVYSAPVERRILAPVADIRASKGAYDDKVVVSWAPVAGADGYRIYSYTDSMDNATEVGDVASSATSYDVMNTVGDSRYYVVAYSTGVDGRRTSTYPMEKNPMGNDEPVNMGYRFDMEALNPIARSYVKEDGHLYDYFTVEFNVRNFASSYEISATAGDIKYQVDPAALNTVGAVKTNGLGKEDVGYIEYDPAEGKIRVNARFNELGKTLQIDEVGITASNSVFTSGKLAVSGDTRRSISNMDYVNCIFMELNAQIAAANKEFAGDWWAGSANVYSKLSGLEIKSDAGASHASSDYGQISFSAYAGNLFDFKYDSVVPIVVKAMDEGGWGYLGTDPLHTVGRTESDNKTSITMPTDCKVNGVPVVYDDATFKLDMITKDSGNIIITIGSNGPVTISAHDPLLKVKLF